MLDLPHQSVQLVDRGIGIKSGRPPGEHAVHFFVRTIFGPTLLLELDFFFLSTDLHRNNYIEKLTEPTFARRKYIENSTRSSMRMRIRAEVKFHSQDRGYAMRHQ